MTEYEYCQFIKNINFKIVIFTIIVCFISVFGEWLFPNLICSIGLFVTKLVSLLLFPFLLIWILFNNRYKKEVPLLLKKLTSIWIGFVIFIFIEYAGINRIIENYWENAALKTEQYIHDNFAPNDQYSKNVFSINDSLLLEENFIYRNYIRQIQIRFIASDSSGFEKVEFNLSRGFWAGNLQIWNREKKEWESVF